MAAEAHIEALLGDQGERGSISQQEQQQQQEKQQQQKLARYHYCDVRRWFAPGFFRWQAPFQLTDSDLFKPYSSTGGRLALVAVRLVFAVWSAAIILWSLSEHQADGYYFFAKMTGWTFLMTTIYFFMAAYYGYADGADPPKENTWPRKMTFLLFETAFSWSPAVVALYWIVVMPSRFRPQESGEMVFAVHTHAVCFMWLILELSWNKVTFHQSHLLVIMPLGLAYSVANLIYQVARKDELHSDLFSMHHSGLLLLVVVAMLIGFYMGYGLSSITVRTRRQMSFTYSRIAQIDDSGYSPDSQPADLERASPYERQQIYRPNMSFSGSQGRISAGPEAEGRPEGQGHASDSVDYEKKYDGDEHDAATAAQESGEASRLGGEPSVVSDLARNNTDSLNPGARREEYAKEAGLQDGADDDDIPLPPPPPGFEQIAAALHSNRAEQDAYAAAWQEVPAPAEDKSAAAAAAPAADAAPQPAEASPPPLLSQAELSAPPLAAAMEEAVSRARLQSLSPPQDDPYLAAWANVVVPQYKSDL
jgi:hypothetical protein